MRDNATDRRPSPIPRDAEGAASETDKSPDATQADQDNQTEPTDPTEPTEPTEPATAAEFTSDWSRGRRIVAAVLAMLVIAAGAGVGYLVTRSPPPDVRPTVSKDGNYTPGTIPSEPAAAAVRAAVDHVPRILSYDYRSLDKHLASVADAMTPEFKSTFTDTFTAAVEPMAAKNKAVTKALVRGAGIANMRNDDTKANLLLFIDQILVSSNGKKSGQTQPRVGQERVAVTMVNVDGAWLVENIKPF